MAELLTSAQMRAVERAAFDSGAASGLDLMERAGAGVVTALFEQFPELGAGTRRAIVLCGPGNNGGDGFVIARLLRARGWTVETFLFGDAGRLPPDAKANHDLWAEAGKVVPFGDWRLRHRFGAGGDAAPELIVDALFGTGLARPLPQELTLELADLEAVLPRGAACRVAVDAPSGLCMDSGRVLGEGPAPGLASAQDLTVSFHRAKLGHVLAEGPDWCGRLRVADIGLTGDTPDAAQEASVALPELRKGGADPSAHKYRHGHALILSGGPGRSGAGRLAARGALRIGAGLATVAAPGAAMVECAAQLTAIMLTRCDGAGDLARLLDDARLNAICLGPGLGVGAATREMVTVALAAGRACVLDADALTSFADDPEILFDRLHAGTVMTPHPGEFARLFPDIAEAWSAPCTTGPAYSKLDAARAAAARAGCTLLLKGADTIVAEPGGKAAVNLARYDRAAPWLATAGAGDVLAGLVTGLLARGLPPFRAAESAAWLHVEAARSFGPGLIAEDLPERIPQVLRAIGL